tara:strand:- start:1198 stop:1392 length:195 start_codon:yes stop_codon:yes gene_type:complete
MKINKEKLFSLVGKKMNKEFTKKELIQQLLEARWYNARPTLFYGVDKKEYNLIVEESEHEYTSV